MKIAVLLGTMKGENSYEYQVIERFLKLPFWKGAEIQVLSAEEMEAEHCHECNLCLENETCPFDDVDEMDNIKKQLMEADIIIAASPAKQHSVTGVMKDWIDRMWYWNKVLKLAGRGFIAVSQDEYVMSYLRDVFMEYGCYYIGGLLIDTGFRDYAKEYSELIQSFIQIYNKPQSVEATAYQEEVFLNMKRLYEEESMELEAQAYAERELFAYADVNAYILDTMKKHLLLAL